MSTTSSKLSSSSGSFVAGVRSKSPSYLRHTVASRGKRTEAAETVKMVNDWYEEQEEKRKEKMRKRVRKRQEQIQVVRTTGYLKPTKATMAKAAGPIRGVRTYVLEGVEVEVPQLALMLFENPVGDKEALKALKLARKEQDIDDLFVGRHTYRNAENVITLKEKKWKKQVLAEHGVDYDEMRRCRVLGLEYEY
ncbi:hypothetical protein QFC24_005595 [Naganishia onofrii]|uniref:Uncharacterized protein n=2 Tax=Naganishia onofrii TaxID=1851511 RepID=A0ACC2X8E7_9TREE|nr:hypothetical protein QFC24_005582 [Naganishia onofrii]KAJ9119881.1 hypothetical protein QFC24_005595 [Naganishia onofrii]